MLILTILTLMSGKQMEVEVVYQDEQVLVVQDRQSGQRFQYPRSEIKCLEEERSGEEAVMLSTAANRGTNDGSKMAFRMSLSGGWAAVHKGVGGGNIGAELQIGSRDLAGKGIFIGGSVGYSGVLGDKKLHYIPLQVVLSVPLMSGKHSPEIGFSFGYGFSASKNKGGICGQTDLSWHYQYSEKGVLLWGVYVRYQQDRIATEERLNAYVYTASTGVFVLPFGTRLVLQF